jgi:hypothetical protein
VKYGHLCGVDALCGGSINVLHSGFETFTKCVGSRTEIPRWVEEVGGTGPNLFYRLLLSRFETDFANKQLF